MSGERDRYLNMDIEFRGLNTLKVLKCYELIPQSSECTESSIENSYPTFNLILETSKAKGMYFKHKLIM